MKKRYYIREMFERLVRGRSPAEAESATAGVRDVLLKAVSRSRGDCKLARQFWIGALGVSG